MSSLNTAKSVLILDSLMNGTMMDYFKEVIGSDIDRPPDVSVDNGEYNEYHRMALQIDTTKIGEMIDTTPIQIPEQYYNLQKHNLQGSIDYVGEIESYKLICEILTRGEINPPESNFQIKPYNVYGSWFNETGMQYIGNSFPFNPYKDLIVNTSNHAYRGAFSLNKMYGQDEGLKQNDVRMYTYIPTGENLNVDTHSRVLRSKPSELTKSRGAYPTIIGEGYEGVATDDEYISSISGSVKTSRGSRPNPEYLPDSMYTFCRKLRTASMGKDIYTLSDDRYTDSLDKIKEEFDKSSVSANQAAYSDLVFIYCVQLNSSYVSTQQWAGEELGLMPKVYMKMLEKYGTLDMNETGLYNGWTQQQDLVNSITGKYKGRGHLSKQPIVNENNLLSNLGMRDEFDKAMLQETYAEHTYCTTYGLECIANGRSIQHGVESMIKQIYDWQNDKGYLLSGTSEGNSSSVLTDIFGANLSVAYPWSYGVPIRYVNVHDTKCNGQVCMLHPTGHTGSDYNFYKVEDNLIVRDATFNSMLTGKIRRVTKVGESPYGNSISILHDINGKVYYTLYAHMSKVYYTKDDVGEEVLVGAPLGVEGSTGYTTGPHLHLEFGKVNSLFQTSPMEPQDIIDKLDKGDEGNETE